MTTFTHNIIRNPIKDRPNKSINYKQRHRRDKQQIHTISNHEYESRRNKKECIAQAYANWIETNVQRISKGNDPANKKRQPVYNSD